MTLLDELLAPPAVQHQLAELCRAAGVSRLEAFGSAVRGDHRPDSDLDLLYTLDPAERYSYQDRWRLAEELSTLFQRPVDLLPRSILEPPHKKHLRAHVLASIRVIYEAA